jgi:transcriptional regulator with PAS, ATPase and Fis domain
MGPINYCKVLESNITSSAPIVNEYDDVIGAITLVQESAVPTYLLEHTLGWVMSAASAISSQIKLRRRDHRLKLMDATLQATLARSNDGYLSIDEAGYIIHINKAALDLLQLEESEHKSIYGITLDILPIKHSLQTGRPLYNQKLRLVQDEAKILLADIEPFRKESKRNLIGAVLKLSPFNPPKGSKKEVWHVVFDDIIGKSAAVEYAKNTAKLVAKKPVNILLIGESGTGKEIFARAIHNFSNPQGQFVAINCASIPQSLIESELFGYESGAFTGAEKNGKKGKIEYANGGTLFLDEIGDMPLDLQPVLLRVLEEKQVFRVGGHKGIPVDFRVIAATNNPSVCDENSSKFRRDLYFRLAVVNIELPPLRERDTDVLMLADNFIRATCEKFGLPTYTLATKTEEILLEYGWPGNVRQLENAMMYAVSIAKSRKIQPSDLPREILHNKNTGKKNRLDKVKALELNIILESVRNCGSIQKAAKQLGISRATLYRRLHAAGRL